MSENLTMHHPLSVLHRSPSFEYVGGGFHEAPKNQDFPRHYHPQGWEAVYYRAGFITCVHGDESFNSEPGLLWLTPPGVEHAELADTAYASVFFEFRAPASMSWPRTVLDDERQNLGRLCAEIVIERAAREVSPLADLLLQELFMRVERLADRQQTNPAMQVVRRAEVLMASSLNHRPKIQDIAEKSGVSISGLRAAFQTVRNKSPLTVLREIRCQRTLSMLRNSTQTLEALADLCGYDSASHLSREIKRSTGKSPGRFRENITAGSKQ